MERWIVVALVGCGRAGPTPEAPQAMPEPRPAPAVKTIELAPVEITDDLGAMKTPLATSRAVVDGVQVPIGYHVVYRAGEAGFGQLRTLAGAPLDDVDPSERPDVLDFCTEADAQSLVAAGGRPWLISHFECTPGAVYLTELSADARGVLAPIGTRPVSFDAWGGVWSPCAGHVSPWGTHLGSEEYEPDAAAWRPATGRLEPDRWDSWAGMLRIYAEPKQATPYRYGYATEVAVAADGAATATKHPALGRFSHEVSVVLPDGRTTYQSDDGGDTGFFLFVADRAHDLSAGHLYAAALEQRGETELAVSWVPLGHATDAEVTALADAGVTFGDLFEVRAPGVGGTCPDGFAYARHTYGRECLKLQPPSAKVADPALAASRLETRRYAAMLGATMELEKGEGVAFDPESGRVFLALSSQVGPMIAEPDEPSDRVRLPPNACGAVFAADTASGVADRDGRPIDSAHVAVSLRHEIAGIPLAEPDADGNRCDPNGIANPDNVTFLPGYGQLAIAEDTHHHANAVLWTWDTREERLVPLMIAPRGGEMTGIQWTPDLLGHAYLTVVVQHPWGVEELPAHVTPDDQRAFVGYLGPFPPLR